MEKEKYVDESWKEQASQEKDVLAESSRQQTDQEKKPADQPVSPETSDQNKEAPEPSGRNDEPAQSMEINFLNYVTSLGYQAMIFMGEIANPVTNAVEKNLTQAKFLIDTLSMLKEKTTGNLNDQEKNLLESSIYELQMKFVQASENTTSPEGNEKA